MRTVAQEVVPKNLIFRKTKLSQNAVFRVSVLADVVTLLHIISIYHHIHYKLVLKDSTVEGLSEESRAKQICYFIPFCVDIPHPHCVVVSFILFQLGLMVSPRGNILELCALQDEAPQGLRMVGVEFIA